jgi:hypothetical protein
MSFCYYLDNDLVLEHPHPLEFILDPRKLGPGCRMEAAISICGGCISSGRCNPEIDLRLVDIHSPSPERPKVEDWTPVVKLHPSNGHNGEPWTGC